LRHENSICDVALCFLLCSTYIHSQVCSENEWYYIPHRSCFISYLFEAQ
jgi:hypothetical protein